MSRFLTIPAGRRAKWVVLAIWLIVDLRGQRERTCPAKFDKIQKNDSTSFLPVQGRVDEGPRRRRSSWRTARSR